MCGICGFTGRRDDDVLRSMLGAIEHRGPDSEGIYGDSQVSLGNRRLSIIDLEDGDQPIYNESGDVVVVYNGEIYNFRELRDDLEKKGHRFQTRSDTEVLVHLYEEVGDELAKYLNGMFAFALWDMRRQRLLIARDQVGVKPLCYWWDGKTLVFGSEIKAILRHPLVTARRDPDATHLLLNVRYVPEPRTLFQNIAKLPPGHLLVVENGDLQVSRYWEWDTSPVEGVSLEEWSEQFLETMSQAVERQMISDVPVGAFLSGGLDSSTIVKFATRHGSDRLKTFTLGFNEPTDELEDARHVAEFFKTDHVEHTMEPNPLSLYPKIIYHVEEPKVNSAQGYYLCQLARRHVKVALSGMGGDELYAGYDIHRYLAVLEKAQRVYRPTVSRLMSPFVNGASRMLDRGVGLSFENTRRGMELLGNLHDSATCYLVLRNAWDLNEHALQKVYTADAARSISVHTRDIFAPYFKGGPGFIGDALWAEFNLKMVDDFLHNEDRVSMAHSLEVRVPFLDLEVVRQALRIPLGVKFQRDNQKAVMKSGLKGQLPASILKKKKWGFTFDPYYQFQKDLRSLACRVLTRDNLERQGLFNPRFIKGILEHPPSKRLHWHYFMLWLAVGLYFWDEIFLEGRDYRELCGPQPQLICT